MAYVDDFSTKSSATLVASLAFVAADFPIHVVDDYLVLGVTVEADGVVLTFSVTGWTQIGATIGVATTANGLYSSMWYKKCVGSAETATVTITGATAALHCHAFLIKDADPTTFLDGTPGALFTVNTVAAGFNSITMTTTQPDTLLLYYTGIDSTTTTPTQCHSAPGPVHFLDSSDNGGANVTANSKVMAGACAGWYIQRTAGVTHTPSWNPSLAASRAEFVIGIRNKAGGAVPGFIDDINPIGTKVMDGHFWVAATTRNNENFKATPLSITSIITHLGTLVGAFDAGAQVVDVHVNPYSAALSSTPAISPTSLTGFEVGFPTTSIDMSSGWLVGSMMESGPKLANFNEGTITTGGTFVLVADVANNYRIFQVMARNNIVNCEGRAIFSCQINQTQTQSGQGTTPPTVSVINKMMVLNRGNTATLAQYHCDYHIINKITIAGGTSAIPVNAQGIYEIGKFLRLKLIQKQGASGLMPLVPIQIGGGDDVYINVMAGSIQFPRIYDRLEKEINYHGATNAIGVTFAPKTGNVVKFTNCVFSSASSYYWAISSTASSGATWDFNGTSVINATVTLKPVMTFTNMTFSDCSAINATGCTLNGCTISNVPLTSGSFVVSS